MLPRAALRPQFFATPRGGIVVRHHPDCGSVEVFIESSGALLVLTPHVVEASTLRGVSLFRGGFTGTLQVA